MNELSLIADADQRASNYIASVDTRRVFPDQAAISALSAFSEALPQHGRNASETLAMLDEIGSSATVVSNGPHYFHQIQNQLF